MSTIPCPGCRALVPDLDGSKHAYIGAAPGCWAIFSEVLAREYGDWAYPAIHRLKVDAYAAQHPGTPLAPPLLAPESATILLIPAIFLV